MNRRNGLPPACLARHPDTDLPILLVYGKMGYIEVNGDPDVEDINREMGITDDMIQAMITGSMFGWHVPGAKLPVKPPANSKEKGISELAILIGLIVGVIMSVSKVESLHEDTRYHQQRQIELLKAGEEADGRVGW